MRRIVMLGIATVMLLGATGCFSLFGVHRDEATRRLKLINVISPKEAGDFRYFMAIYDDDLNDKHFGLIQLYSWDADW